MRDFVDGMVHPCARHDALTAAHHRGFIAPRLLGGIAALGIFPAYLAWHGAPGIIEVAVLAWFTLPIAAACYLSRTGHYERAHILSALTLTALTVFIAWQTGGSASFAAVWLIVVPFEAALSASRRVIAISSGIALTGAAVLLVFAAPAGVNHTLAALGIVPAVLYAGGLAWGTELLARRSAGLLNAEEDRYRLLASNITDVITRHGKNGEVLFASPAARALFGASPRELAGFGLFERVHVADRPAYLTALADAADGKHGVSIEFRVRTGDDATNFSWIEMRCRKLETGDGAPEVVAVLRDIGARKAQEEAVAGAKAALERANAGKSRFLSTMSHELRTPLNAIIGFSQMLEKEDELLIGAEKRAEYARLIHDSGTHLLSVVNGILDMSKMESGNFEITPEPFAPASVLTGCCDLLSLKAKNKNVDLKCRLPSQLPEIVADKRALNQILINLVSNAIKFTGEGGRVTLMASQEDRQLVISVEDTGVGIAENDMPRIGEAFFQTRAAYDRRHDGSGLGLSIVKGLVELHGGTLRITSRVGEGTTVTVTLPLDCEGARRTAKPVPLVRPEPQANSETETTTARKRA